MKYLPKATTLTAICLIFLLCVFTTGCDCPQPTITADKNTVSEQRKTEVDDEDTDGVIGMTYSGKIGVDVGGIVIPMDGSTPGLGFSF